MAWSLFTYFFGIPVSEMHGLIGGLVGAAVATAGLDVVQWQGLREVLAGYHYLSERGLYGRLLAPAHLLDVPPQSTRESEAMVHTPPTGVRSIYGLQPRPQRCAEANGNFGDDTGPLYVGGREVHVPMWVVVSCAAVAAVGTAYGGWRIIHTLGRRITTLDPVQGFAAEVAGATVIQIASELGIPVSTTHAITSSILGVGAIRRLSAVRWAIMADIFASWC